MAEKVINEEEEKKSKSGGDGNRNALAYGLLQGAGYNTTGMSPSDAWAMVDALKLMDREARKKTDTDKGRESSQKEEAKKSGMTKDAVVQKAGDVANRVSIHTSNAPEMNKAIDVIASLQKEFGTEKLGKISAQSRIGRGIFSAMGCANGNELTLSGTLLNNPGAAYRRNVTDYKSSRQSRIQELEAGIASETKPKVIESLKKSLEKAKDAAKYDRHNVIYEGKEVESVTYHEYGHVLADKLFGQINGSKYLQADEQTAATKRALVEKTFRDAHDDGSIRKISEYGATNSAEFFAEAFTIYKMGVEKLPPAINNMMKEVLKK